MAHCPFNLLHGLETVNLAHFQGWVTMTLAGVFRLTRKGWTHRLDGQDPHKQRPRLTS